MERHAGATPTADVVTFPAHPPIAMGIVAALAIGIGLPGIVDRVEVGTVVAAAVALVAVLGAIHGVLRKTTLRHEPTNGTLTIVTSRPPLATLVHTIRLAAVAEVNVERTPRRERVVIRLGDGDEFGLGGAFPASLDADALADRIRAWAASSRTREG